MNYHKRMDRMNKIEKIAEMRQTKRKLVIFNDSETVLLLFKVEIVE